jgi:two-component system, chemotaxis family, protein-glutamate methylesterase/glutaminase
MINVMLVDDSAVIRGLIGRMIDAEPDMRVAASAPTGKTALELLRHKTIDVVILDIEMPEMDGLTALPLILREKPETRVIMASSLTTRGARVTMQALALGAADYIGKPSALSAVRGMEAISRELIAKVRALGAIRSDASPEPQIRTVVLPPPKLEDGAAPGVLVIASSTGGPNALAKVLAQLPRDFPLPTLIAQHMPAMFTASLAERLEREGGRPCREAKHGEPIEHGCTYIAPGDFHMRIRRHQKRSLLFLDQDPPVNFCRPSADALLISAAEVFGAAVVALVLTGMGEDGLRGCEAVVQAGGRVIAQNRETSVVWGMPGAVTSAGLASSVLPLDRIAGQLTALCTIGV